MTINLLELAKRADQLYRDVECSFGTIRVYHVPDAALLSVDIGIPEPEQPIVRMETATGHQNRLSKPGDDEYEKWQSDLAAYNEGVFRLRAATRLVTALKDVDWSLDISNPPTSVASNIYNGNWPDDIMLRKKIWLDFTVMSIRSDSDKIINAVNEMNGETRVTDDMVNDVKKNSE